MDLKYGDKVSYKNCRREFSPNQSFNAALLTKWIKRILYSPVLLYYYLQEKTNNCNNINRFKLQLQKNLNKINCSLSMIKEVVVGANILAVICGTVLLFALSIAALPEENFTFIICGITVGLVVCIVSLFGCYGAYRESPTYMWTYAIFHSILLVIQLLLIVSFHSMDFVRMAIDELEQLWAKDLSKRGPMAQVESALNCCGMHGSNDYTTLNRTIPLSCYYKDEDSKLHLIGCVEAIDFVYMYIGKIIRNVNIILTVLEAFSVIFACILARNFRSFNHMRYVTNPNDNIFSKTRPMT